MRADLVGQLPAYQARRALTLESGLLFLWQLHLAANRENLVGLDGETGEQVLRPAILVHTTEPLLRHHFTHSGDLLDFFPVGFRHRKGERHLVGNGEAQGLGRRRLADVERGVNRHQDAQQRQRRRDAEDGKDSPAPIAPGVPENQ